MRYNLTLRLILLFFLSITLQNRGQQKNDFTWYTDNLKEIGGYPVSVFGNPAIQRFPFGNALEFDGADDGLIVHGFPFNREETFTAEIIFNPYASFPNNVEQRFLHVQSPARGSRRFLIELRLNDKNQWYIDTHIRADTTFLTSLAKEFPHPVNEWYHVVFTYKDGVARHYVNGAEEMSGKVKYIPVDTASVSIGMRMNKVSFFKGAVYSVAFSKRELNPSEFLLSSEFEKVKSQNPSGQIIFGDNFINDAGNWISEFEKPSASSFKIQNGLLELNSSAGATLWYKNKLSGNIIISFDAELVNKGGVNDRVSDLNMFWMASDPNNKNIFTRNGKFSSYDDLNLYYAGIGGHDNTTTRFRKYSGNEKPVVKEYLDKEHLLEGNKNYSIKIYCFNGNTSLYVNDRLFFNYNDKNPLAEGYFAFRTTKSHLFIKNFRVLSITQGK